MNRITGQLFLILLGLAGILPAQQAAKPGSSGPRWSEQAYGFSMEPPQDLEAREAGNGAVLYRAVESGLRYVLTLEADRPEAAMTLEQAAAVARELVRRGSPGSLYIDDPALSRQVDLNGRPGYVVYHYVPVLVDNQPETNLFGKLIIQIDPTTFLHLAIQCLRKHEEKVRPVFEQLIRTVRLADPRELDGARGQQIKSGQAALRRLTDEAMHRMLLENSVYRLLDQAGKDIGYVKIREGLTEQDTRPGVGIEVQHRILSGPTVLDTRSMFFLAQDRSFEKWSSRQTHRPLGAAKEAEKFSHAVTGIRINTKLMVVTDGPEGPRQKAFVIPEEGYLNQVEALLLDRWVPADLPATYGFYAWNPDQAGLSFRTDRVVPTLSGFTLETRRSPNDLAVRNFCDTDGKLIEQHLAGGRKLVVSTAAELQRLWQER